MKICVLTTSFPRYPGDKSGVFLLDVLEALSFLCRSITVVAPDDILFRTYRKPKELTVEKFSYFFPRNLQLLAYGGGLEVNIRKSWFAKLQLIPFSISFLITAVKEARKADIIHAHWTFAGLIAVLIKKVLHKKVIITVHGSDLAIAKKGLLNKITKFILNEADILTAVSQSLAKEVSNQLKIEKNVLVIPNGISEDFLNVRRRSTHGKLNRIVFIGRLHRSKGIDTLLKALNILNKRMPEVGLVVVGGGDNEGDLRKLAKELDVDDKTSFIGEVGRSKIPVLLEKSDVLILPSRREGFGVVLIEAMASGLPVIGSDTGGISEIIRDGYNGFKFPVSDHKRLASLIYKLLNDKALYKKMSKNSKRFVMENYSLKNIARKYFNAYKS